jgi:hypothetical protein
MLTIKNSELLQLHGSLSAMQNLKRLSPRLIYFVAKNLRKVEESLQPYHSEKNALLEKFGTPIKDKPGAFSFELENGKAFIEADKKAQDETHELDLARVKFAEVESYQKATEAGGEGMTPAMLSGLWPVLDGEPSES